MDLEETRDKLAATLEERNARIVFAESCTAGLCSATMGQIDGISASLCGSAVTYRAETKTGWLEVRASTIEENRCESVDVAQEMATSVLEKTPEADWAVGVVGHIAEGQECFACVSVARRNVRRVPQVVKHSTMVRPLDGHTRTQRQRQAAQVALEVLWQAIRTTDATSDERT